MNYVDTKNRTFETRLLFIKELFTHTYTEEDIFKKCVQYKLKISYEQYEKNLDHCLKMLLVRSQQHPVWMLKKINKKGENK